MRMPAFFISGVGLLEYLSNSSLLVVYITGSVLGFTSFITSPSSAVDSSFWLLPDAMSAMVGIPYL